MNIYFDLSCPGKLETRDRPAFSEIAPAWSSLKVRFAPRIDASKFPESSTWTLIRKLHRVIPFPSSFPVASSAISTSAASAAEPLAGGGWESQLGSEKHPPATPVRCGNTSRRETTATPQVTQKPTSCHRPAARISR
jgi:hypothetical protein